MAANVWFRGSGFGNVSSRRRQAFSKSLARTPRGVEPKNRGGFPDPDFDEIL
jgi:hypothetical protein